MRGWYQQYAVPLPRTSVDSVSTGYMVASTPVREQAEYIAKSRTVHEFAPVVARPRPTPGPHFMDFEGNLAEQRAAGAMYLSARRNFPPLQEGVARVPGFRPAPWKDRPEG